MSQAVFALLGAALGVLGAVLSENVRSRQEDKRARREALRTACADLTAAVIRVRVLAFDVYRNRTDEDARVRVREAHGDCQVSYQRFRLLTDSLKAQEAARFAIRHAWSLILRCEGRPPRAEEGERGALALLYDSLSVVVVEVRRELGLADPEAVFDEPEAWTRFPATPGPEARSEDASS